MFSVFFLIDEFVGLEFNGEILDMGLQIQKKCTSKNLPPLLSEFGGGVLLLLW